MGRDGINHYLDLMGQVPLLSADQEITLSRCYRQWMDNPSCSQVVALQGKRAKDKLITANLRLVVHLSKKYWNRGLEFEDLIQEGTLGLNRAVEKYDPSKGYRFSTYAYWWIRQALTRAIAEKSRLIHLPSHVWEKVGQLKKIRREYLQKYGRLPSMSELAVHVSLSEDELSRLLEQVLKTDCTSLDLRVGHEETTALLDLIPDSSTDPFESVVNSNVREVIEAFLETLPSQESAVIRLKYGLKNGQCQTLQAISERLGISRAQAYQIQRRVLRKLSHMSIIQELVKAA